MFLRFIQSLHESGRPEIVPGRGDPAVFIADAADDPVEREKAGRLLRGWHSEAALEFPGQAPDYHPEAALWGASLFFKASCLMCFRDVDEAGIDRLLPVSRMPDETSPAAIFSADLCLRYWPDLHRSARALSEDDALVKRLRRFAEMFPLSSCGMETGIPPEHPVVSHRGLFQLFCERALARADATALEIPTVRNFISLKLGAHAAKLSSGLSGSLSTI